MATREEASSTLDTFQALVNYAGVAAITTLEAAIAATTDTAYIATLTSILGSVQQYVIPSGSTYSIMDSGVLTLQMRVGELFDAIDNANATIAAHG